MGEEGKGEREGRGEEGEYENREEVSQRGGGRGGEERGEKEVIHEEG